MSDFGQWAADLAKEPGVVGAIGAIVSLQWMPGTTYKQKAFAILTGAAVAYYLMPYVLEVMLINTTAGILMMGFMSGVLGPNLLGKAYSYVAETTFGELLSRFWSKR